MKGRAFKYGDNVDTDVIIPARYLNSPSPGELARHCMEDIDPGFAGSVQQGDFIVAGENFGCGSSREHAPIAIKAAGVQCVIAASFARIFYRNAINMGFAILESKEAAAAISAGDVLSVDYENGLIQNHTTGQSFNVAPFPPFIRSIMQSGGLLSALKARQEGSHEA